MIKKLIRDWRKKFQLPVREKFTFPSNQEFSLNVDLINEELDELKEAFLKKDKIGVLDALGDLEFVLEQMNCSFGVRMENIVPIIYVSNMSKGCYTKEGAELSVEEYAKKGINANYVKMDEDWYLIFREDGKLLKGINFLEPNFPYDKD